MVLGRMGCVRAYSFSCVYSSEHSPHFMFCMVRGGRPETGGGGDRVIFCCCGVGFGLVFFK